MKKLEEIERNQSKMHLSRGHRNMQMLRAINRKETDKLQETETGASNPHYYNSEPKERAEPN
jgi:hypothetical protein